MLADLAPKVKAPRRTRTVVTLSYPVLNPSPLSEICDLGPIFIGVRAGTEGTAGTWVPVSGCRLVRLGVMLLSVHGCRIDVKRWRGFWRNGVNPDQDSRGGSSSRRAEHVDIYTRATRSPFISLGNIYDRIQTALAARVRTGF